ncbi:hypothetical protein SAMN06265222_105109 [Neorhodopirellula lusitana]|uniref:Secreted protein n=1 Tax=Neorhodopirellula lusitana TaxID=445327 RepID=A0ABY1Q1G2_9BACT|nr:hypothetical protein [Neorhodopirellula lusitana]SMP56209.1 hypothetical protein SAMN06265222_105109 [Neorhodopirellula lusitana]
MCFQIKTFALMFLLVSVAIVPTSGCGQSGELRTAFDGATAEQLAAARERDGDEERLAAIEVDDEE